MGQKGAFERCRMILVRAIMSGDSGLAYFVGNM